MGKLKYPLGILLTIVIGIILTMWLCCGNCFTGDCNDGDTVISEQNSVVPDANLTEVDVDYGWNLNDLDGNLVSSSKYNLDFELNGFKHLTPVNENLESSFKQLGTYLDNNETSKLLLTGLYQSNEENSSAFTNLGEARANDARNYLSSLGFDPSRIGISGLLKDDLNLEGSVVKGPINYGLGTMPAGEDVTAANKALDDLATRIKADPLVLYFKTGSDNVSLTAAQRQKISDMNKYIGARPDGRILISGHTDNVGNRSSNIQLSKERADGVKAYLINNGIPEAKIETIGKGSSAPIAPNTTASGRAKNRRVEVTLK